MSLLKKKIEEYKIESPLGLEWITKVTNEPKDLIPRLQEKGFEFLESYYKMGIDLGHFEMNQPDIDSVFVAKEVEFENMLNNSVLQLLKDCFPEHFIDLDDAKNKMIVSEQISKNEGNQIIHFLVFKDQIPVATAHMEIMNNIPFSAYLNGAETAEQYRGKEIYSLLLFKRIQKCKELGLRYLLVDSDPLTSGPILSKFGFKIIDKSEVYRLKIDLTTQI